jgi:hypothetical protein
VSRNGQPEPYALERLSNGVRVRIGAPDVLLRFGAHEYRITYRTTRQIGFFEDHDELYWNVNGTGWTFAFERISAEVRFDVPVPGADLKVEAYTGPQGSRARHYQVFVGEGSAAFRTTRALGPREGLTIVVAFPKGVVAPPGPAARFDAWIESNPGALAALAGVLLLTLYLVFIWRIVGRDPAAGPRFPRYEPPAGLGAGSVRWLDRMGYDGRAFAAALLGLGAGGYLRIREHDGRQPTAASSSSRSCRAFSPAGRRRCPSTGSTAPRCRRRARASARRSGHASGRAFSRATGAPRRSAGQSPPPRWG